MDHQQYINCTRREHDEYIENLRKHMPFKNNCESMSYSTSETGNFTSAIAINFRYETLVRTEVCTDVIIAWRDPRVERSLPYLTVYPYHEMDDIQPGSVYNQQDELDVFEAIVWVIQNTV